MSSSSRSIAKGGKPKVQHNRAREIAVAHSAAFLSEKKTYLEADPSGDSYVTAHTVLAINGWGYVSKEGVFTEVKPEKTKGKSAQFHDDYRPQFYITVGWGRGKDGQAFGNTVMVCVSNPIFFKDGNASSADAKLVGGHDPILKVGDYVFYDMKEGLATYTQTSGFWRGSACLERSKEKYLDLIAILPREEARKDWIRVETQPDGSRKNVGILRIE